MRFAMWQYLVGGVARPLHTFRTFGMCLSQPTTEKEVGRHLGPLSDLKRGQSESIGVSNRTAGSELALSPRARAFSSEPIVIPTLFTSSPATQSPKFSIRRPCR